MSAHSSQLAVGSLEERIDELEAKIDRLEACNRQYLTLLRLVSGAIEPVIDDTNREPNRR